MSLSDLVCYYKHSHRSCISYDDGQSCITLTWTYSNFARVSALISCVLRKVFSELYCSQQVKIETVSLCGKMSPEMLAAIVGILSLPASFCPIDLYRPPSQSQHIGKLILVHLSILEDFLSHSHFAASCTKLLTNLMSHGFIIAILNSEFCWKSINVSPQCTSLRVCDQCRKMIVNGVVPSSIGNTVCRACHSNAENSHLDLEMMVSPSTIAYVLQTSGTTGAPKKVSVPHCCIVPNITDLGRRFGLNPEDRVFNAAPLTFDPSVVEIFLSLSYGACLVIVPDTVKSTPSLLSRVLVCRQKITVLQTTPSLFCQLPSDVIVTRLLGEFSFLRVLAFGGEVCPSLSTLRRWKNTKNSTQIFNIYGITEVSCWATCHEVVALSSPPPCSLSSINSTDMVPIGDCLMGTDIELRDCVRTETGIEGTLWIGGTSRVCLLGEENSLVKNTWRSSGDRVFRDQVSGDMFIIGRSDRQIKRLGHRINLDYIQQIMSSLPDVSSCTVLTSSSENGPQLLVAAIVPATKPFQLRDLLKELNKILPSSHIPDKFVCVDSIPINSHGKIDLTSLCVTIEHLLKPSSKLVLALDKDKIKEILIDVTRTVMTRISLSDNLCLEHSLPELGANSFDVVRIISLLEDRLFQASQFIPSDVGGVVGWFELFMKSPLVSMVDAVHSSLLTSDSAGDNGKQKLLVVEESLDTASTSKSSKSDEGSSDRSFLMAYRRGVVTFNGRKIDQTVFPTTQYGQLSLNELWTVPTGKCVDSSPLVVVTATSSSGPMPSSAMSLSAMVYIGSHSGLFLAIELDSGIERWSLLLPDRVESSACVSLCGKYIIIGCYDGCVYIVEASSGNVEWCFQTDGKSSGDPMKSSPSVHPTTGFLWFGSHDKHLYCIDISRKQLVHKVFLDGGSCFSSPAISSDGSAIYVATLRGNLFSVHSESGRKQWWYECSNPIFSSPCVLPGGNIAFGCVNGHVYVLDPLGHQIDILQTNEAVFSSCISATSVPGEPLLYCASNSGYLNCWEYCKSCYQLKWNIELNGPVYSTPMIDVIEPLYSKTHSEHALLKETLLDTVTYSEFVVLCVCSSKGTLYLVNPVDGSLLSHFTLPGESFSSPVVVGSKVIIGCRDNKVYCLETSVNNNLW